MSKVVGRSAIRTVESAFDSFDRFLSPLSRKMGLPRPALHLIDRAEKLQHRAQLCYLDRMG